MTFIEQLVQSLDARLEHIHGEIDALARAREELAANGNAPTRVRSRQNRRRAATRRRATRPSKKPASIDSLRVLLEADVGLSTAELARQSNAETAKVLPLLREMEAAGSVRRTGQRRGTRWHAVGSEEEWIAQRAAELAARSRKS
jgi:type II secretory pathway component PulF